MRKPSITFTFLPFFQHLFDLLKGLLTFFANRVDSTKAESHDERQNQRVLDRCRPVFTAPELLDCRSKSRKKYAMSIFI